MNCIKAAKSEGESLCVSKNLTAEDAEEITLRPASLSMKSSATSARNSSAPLRLNSGLPQVLQRDDKAALVESVRMLT